MLNTTGRFAFPLAAAVAMTAAPFTTALADPRDDVLLRWTAPAIDGGSGPAARYEIRTSAFPPGSDLDAWWAGALPEGGAPVPHGAGSVETWVLDALPAGSTWVAVRAFGSTGLPGALTAVPAVQTSALPFITRVSPGESEAGPVTLRIEGHGVGTATGVRCHAADGSILTAGLLDESGGALLASVEFPGGAGGPFDVEVLSATGSDRVAGWFLVRPDPALPPNTVDDVAAQPLTSEMIRLTWTAPGDPGAEGPEPVAAYEVRRLAGGPGAWAWTGGTPLVAPIPLEPGRTQILDVAGLAPSSTYAFAVRSRDAGGNWSMLSNFAEGITPAPPMPPSVVLDLAATAADAQAVDLAWTAPHGAAGAGVPVTQYDLRRLKGSIAAGWSWDEGTAVAAPAPSAPGTTERVRIGGLAPGSETAFAVRSLGPEGAWSDVSNVAVLRLPAPPDTTPPAAVTDLAAARGDDDVWRLLWTAPGDQGIPVTRYELRRAEGVAGSFAWATASAVADPPVPAAPGEVQLYAVEVAPGTAATFAIVSYDGAGNASARSNLATVDRRAEDVTAPAPVAGLELSRVSDTTVQIRWRAPGDDGMQGRADHYELRRALNPDAKAAWWEPLPSTTLDLVPKPPGKRERVNVTVGSTGGVWGFALAAVDEAGNRSPWVAGLLYVAGQASAGVDASPPSSPAGVRAERRGSTVHLTWSASPDPDVARYRIRRFRPEDDLGERIGEVPASTTAFDDRSVVVGAQYTVTAVDGEGNESAMAIRVGIESAGAVEGIGLRHESGAWRITVDAPAEAGAGDPPRMAVFDVRGRRVASVEPIREGSAWTARWDGRAAASGVYFLRVDQGGALATRKILVTR